METQPGQSQRKLEPRAWEGYLLWPPREHLTAERDHESARQPRPDATGGGTVGRQGLPEPLSTARRRAPSLRVPLVLPCDRVPVSRSR